MRRPRLSSLLCAAILALAMRQGGMASDAIAFAVVRIPSHGASATVIATRPGETVLLGCAHAFRGADRGKTLRLDVPAPNPTGDVKRAAITLVALDEAVDLSLIVLRDGPLDFVAPVAPPGHRPGPNLLSVGYDGMRVPAEQRPATLLERGAATLFTRERPGHGRSGGALLDLDAGYLIGVVQGYETTGQRRGMYVGHATILRFLERAQKSGPPAAKPKPPCPT